MHQCLVKEAVMASSLGARKRGALLYHLGADDLPGLGLEGGGVWSASKVSRETRGVVGAGGPLCNNSDF